MDDRSLLHQTMAREVVLRELQGVMLAEIAMLSSDPVAKLELMLGSEEGASMESLGKMDLDNPVTRMILTEMDTYRDQIFEFARKVLARLMATRQSGPQAD